MDKVSQRRAAGIGSVVSAESDLHTETVGRPVDRHNVWCSGLSRERTTLALQASRTFDPGIDDVRQAGQRVVREAVLVHCRCQAVERRTAQLEHGVEVASECAHFTPPPGARVALARILLRETNAEGYPRSFGVAVSRRSGNRAVRPRGIVKIRRSRCRSADRPCVEPAARGAAPESSWSR